MDTEEVEFLVTVPIEYALNGLPFIRKIRSSSEFGLSVVTAIFDDRRCLLCKATGTTTTFDDAILPRGAATDPRSGRVKF